LRDLLDRASRDQLRSGADALDGAPFLKFAVGGTSGRVLPLALVALTVGRAADEPTSAWQRMAFPSELRDRVARVLEAPPVVVNERFDRPLPTSPAAGRLVLLVLGGTAAFGVLRARRKPAL